MSARQISTAIPSCPIGMRREIPYSQVLKKFEKQEAELADAEHLVLNQEDIERQHLLFEQVQNAIRDRFPIPDDSEVDISDCVSHETVDSKGELIKVMIKKELASIVDIQKHMAKKRVGTAAAARFLGKIRRAIRQDSDERTITDASGNKVNQSILEERFGRSDASTVNQKKSSKIKAKTPFSGQRIETPPEFIDSDLGLNYDDMLMGKSIDTADIAHDPKSQDKMLKNHQRSLDMLDEKSSPLKLNLKDLKEQHMEFLGHATPTPYGSLGGHHSARNREKLLHHLTNRSKFSRKRSQDADSVGLVPIEYRDKLSAYDIEKFKPYLER